MIWKNLYYSGLRRIFAGLFIIVFISVNAGNLMLYALFSSALTEETKTASLQMLTKVKNATELVYNEIISLSTNLGHGNITITRLMFEEEKDRILEYQSHQIMRNAMVSFPYIDYIAVYNERLDEIIATKYFAAETGAELKNLANRYFQYGEQNLTIPLTVMTDLPYPDAPGSDTVTIIIYSPLSLVNDKGALIVGISRDYFEQLIRKMDEGDLEEVMILHGNGALITRTKTDRNIPGDREAELMNGIYGGDADTGFFMNTEKGEKVFVSFTKSGILNWTFVSVIPWSKMAAKLIFLKNLTFIITLLILCAGLFVSYFMALNMYKPVQHILKRFNYTPGKRRAKSRSGAGENRFRENENNSETEFIEKRIDYLSSAAEISEPLVRNAFILDLLANRHNDGAFTDLQNRIIEAAFREPYYLVCVLSAGYEETIDSQVYTTSGGPAADGRNVLEEIAAEMFKKAGAPVDYAALSPSDIAVVLHLENGAVPDALVPLLMETAEMTKKYSGFSVSASLGSIVNSVYAINDSFEEAEAGLKERFFIGEETVIPEKAGKERTEIDYPRPRGELLFAAVLAGDTAGIQKALEDFRGAIEKTTYEYARMYLNTIVMEALSFCLANKLTADAASFYRLTGMLQRARTLKKASSLLAEFFTALAGNISDNPADSVPLIVSDAVKLVEENYRDPVFSMNTAAESLNITPAYFNRVFKKYHRISYSEYLNEFRIEKACELLARTNESITGISAAVGISNTTYFYTLFRKIHGITPQRFRSAARKLERKPEGQSPPDFAGL